MDERAKEEWLLERCRRGEREAFDELFDDYLPFVYNLAVRLLNDPEAAQDVVQETFVRVYQNLSRFSGRSRLSTWIYRIVVNLCLDERRRQSRQPETVSAEEEEETLRWLEQLPDEDPGPEARTLQEERHRVLWQAVQRLPEPFRATLILCDLEEWSYSEAAEVLGVAEGTVKSRLNRARKMLRQELEPYRELFEAE
jgi:RNA polymerase sigma-70 factor (ECF subfamily)